MRTRTRKEEEEDKDEDQDKGNNQNTTLLERGQTSGAKARSQEGFVVAATKPQCTPSHCRLFPSPGQLGLLGKQCSECHSLTHSLDGG